MSVGECQKRILDAASRYTVLKEQHEKDGKKSGPEGDGVLIFDEVRVVARLMRNQCVVGFSMSHDDMANLLDVYQALDPDAALLLQEVQPMFSSFSGGILPPHSMLWGHITLVARPWRASLS